MSLTGARNHDYRYEVLTSGELVIGEIETVLGGTLSASIYNTIRSGGKLDMDETDIDWLSERIRITYVLHEATGDVEYPLGVYLPATPVRNADGATVSMSVEVYDKLQILADVKVAETYTIGAGTVATDAIRDIIEDAGESKISVTPSAETLSSAMSWEPGSTYLQIVNGLLDAINYFSLWADGLGYYRADPYLAPSSRSSVWTFDDADVGLYLPDLTETYDNFGVPNHIIRVASSPDVEMVAEATNDDPVSPYSTVSRGRTISDYAVVEATSQTALDAITSRALAEATQVSRTVKMQHPLLPAILLNSAVTLRNQQLGLSARYTVLSQTHALDCGSLVTATIREVTS